MVNVYDDKIREETLKICNNTYSIVRDIELFSEIDPAINPRSSEEISKLAKKICNSKKIKDYCKTQAEAIAALILPTFMITMSVPYSEQPRFEKQVEVVVKEFILDKCNCYLCDSLNEDYFN